MYLEFFDIDMTASKNILNFLRSEAFSREIGTLYGESEFWKNLRNRTFVGINSNAAMLYSGHNFTHYTPAKTFSNILIKYLTNFRFFRSIITRLHVTTLGLLRRISHYEKNNSVKYFDRKNYGAQHNDKVEKCFQEVMQYNASKVYDSLENLYSITPFLKDINEKETPMFFELGAGAGLTVLSLLEYYPGSKAVIVDLPETICVGYVLINFFSKGKYRIILPDEAAQKGVDNVCQEREFDILYLTPNQSDMIPDKYVDLCVNANSMQEMTMETVRNYFTLIKKMGREQCIFYCKNLIQSKQYEETKFDEYPWEMMGNVLYEGISPFASKNYPEGGNIAIKIVRVKK